MTSVAPGPWLRLCALARVRRGRCSPSSPAPPHLGTTHRLLAALVAPPLAALLVAAWLAHRELVPAVLAASALFTAAAALPSRGAHAALAALRARGAARRHARRLPRRARAVGLVARLRGADEAAHHVAAARHRLLRDDRRRPRLARARPSPSPAMVGLALACGGASALNHVLDRDIDPLMGERTKQRPGRVRPRRAEPRARVRARALGVLVRPAREHGERAHRGARARRQSLLRPRLHALAEALDAAEHRHRRRRGRRAAARRLGRRDRRRDDRPRSSSSRSSSSGRRRTSGRSRS